MFNQLLFVGDDYDAIKNTIGEMMVEQLCKLYPQVRDHIDYKGQKISQAYFVPSIYLKNEQNNF